MQMYRIDLPAATIDAPPTAPSQQPGYATLSGVARLQRNNQENTHTGQRVRQPDPPVRGAHQAGGPMRGTVRGGRHLDAHAVSNSNS